jgi:uncharacterized membrane protein
MSGDDAEPRDGDEAEESDRGEPDGIGDITPHFYRGEIDRTTAWRSRLDQTTNWAVVVVAAILTWAFSSPDNPHYVLLIGVFAVAGFLVMEANRYREYDVWRDRVRTIQKEAFAAEFDPSESPGTDWRADLAEQLRHPTFSVSFRHALAHRLRRIYLLLLLILLVSWVTRITVFDPDQQWPQAASILGVPGEFVVGAVGVFYAVLLSIAVFSALGSRVREFEE